MNSFLKNLGVIEGSRIKWTTVMIIAALTRVLISCDLIALLFLSLVLLAWSREEKIKCNETINEQNSFISKLNDLESKVNALAIGAAFRGKL
jgi:hypothetical protein